jgi:hypothetical protein
VGLMTVPPGLSARAARAIFLAREDSAEFSHGTGRGLGLPPRFV